MVPAVDGAFTTWTNALIREPYSGSRWADFSVDPRDGVEADGFDVKQALNASERRSHANVLSVEEIGKAKLFKVEFWNCYSADQNEALVLVWPECFFDIPEELDRITVSL